MFKLFYDNNDYLLVCPSSFIRLASIPPAFIVIEYNSIAVHL